MFQGKLWWVVEAKPESIEVRLYGMRSGYMAWDSNSNITAIGAKKLQDGKNNMAKMLGIKKIHLEGNWWLL